MSKKLWSDVRAESIPGTFSLLGYFSLVFPAEARPDRDMLEFVGRGPGPWPVLLRTIDY